MTIGQAYTFLYSAALLCMGVLIAVLLYRAVRGPRIADRLIAVNMIGTLVIAIFVILCAMLDEGYLVDIALIYALISFVSILVFSAVYIRKRKEED